MLALDKSLLEHLPSVKKKTEEYRTIQKKDTECLASLLDSDHVRLGYMLKRPRVAHSKEMQILCVLGH